MRKWIICLAQTTIGGYLVRRMFASFSFAIPVKRLRETKTLIAFLHPHPSYAVHILIVPKKALGGLGDLGPEDTEFFQDLFATVNSLVGEYGLTKTGYRLIVNGGKYQEVGQLHFHLVADENPYPT